MILKEYIVLSVIIIILAMAPIIIIQDREQNKSEMERFEKYGVYEVQNVNIQNGKLIRAYQVKNELGRRHKGDLDKQTKLQLCYILWYSYNHFENVEEVEIISYYNYSGKMLPYYTYRTGRWEIEISKLGDASESEVLTYMEYYYRKLVKIGKLNVMDENIPYWMEEENGYSDSNK
ncbi:conserved hypothetical protein [Methanococcus vannielii SB]|jgi:hypothetical protein|uniref:DUF4825 domain-containing protein n=1 Tax=Methanococcus vannielii (strain ATCC 35089 / DSM 1224 / JCM 13029 / OCM 148 / SB) TaxID=406327 RepID=A6UPR0_METVS|nr:hypothetical protein [Methanococcus vannielii]ABR54482.1 conserved hypothetical protein [Methanococcus vannielii SB]